MKFDSLATIYHRCTRWCNYFVKNIFVTWHGNRCSQLRRWRRLQFLFGTISTSSNSKECVTYHSSISWDAYLLRCHSIELGYARLGDVGRCCKRMGHIRFWLVWFPCVVDACAASSMSWTLSYGTDCVDFQFEISRHPLSNLDICCIILLFPGKYVRKDAFALGYFWLSNVKLVWVRFV
jgi:hypothetical protein